MQRYPQSTETQVHTCVSQFIIYSSSESLMPQHPPLRWHIYTVMVEFKRPVIQLFLGQIKFPFDYQQAKHPLVFQQYSFILYQYAWPSSCSYRQRLMQLFEHFWLPVVSFKPPLPNRAQFQKSKINSEYIQRLTNFV